MSIVVAATGVGGGGDTEVFGMGGRGLSNHGNTQVAQTLSLGQGEKVKHTGICRPRSAERGMLRCACSEEVEHRRGNTQAQSARHPGGGRDALFSSRLTRSLFPNLQIEPFH